MKFAKSIEEYFAMNQQWEKELLLLREIMLSSEAEETLKWGAPTYTINKKNVAGLGAFKSYVGIWFHQGVFLKDKHKKLLNAQEGKTKALRQWRFDSVEEITENAALIKSYLEEAIENQKAGKSVKAEKKSELVLPEELQLAFKEDANLKTSFDQFTPGRKREFAEYVSEAKRAATRQSRMEKIKPMILAGIGLNDKYRK